MPSRSNPNTPTSLKRKSAAQLKSKRKQTQRKVIRSKVAKSVPKSFTTTTRTSPNAGTGTIATKSTNSGIGPTTTGSGRRVTGTSQAIRKENARRRRLEQAVKREKAGLKRGKRGDGHGEAMDVEVEAERVGGEEVGMDVD